MKKWVFFGVGIVAIIVFASAILTSFGVSLKGRNKITESSREIDDALLKLKKANEGSPRSLASDSLSTLSPSSTTLVANQVFPELKAIEEAAITQYINGDRSGFFRSLDSLSSVYQKDKMATQSINLLASWERIIYTCEDGDLSLPLAILRNEHTEARIAALEKLLLYADNQSVKSVFMVYREGSSELSGKEIELLGRFGSQGSDALSTLSMEPSMPKGFSKIQWTDSNMRTIVPLKIGTRP